MYFVLLALSALALAVTYWWVCRTFATLKNACKDGSKINYFDNENTRQINVKEALANFESYPSELICFLVLTEDADFFKHKGFNLRELYRCFKLCVTRKRLRGGSSISQQLSKLVFTRGELTIRRKFIEILGALALERNYSKLEILALYMEHLRFFPYSVYGFTHASEKFFLKPTRALSLGELVLLVVLIPNPRLGLENLEKDQLAKPVRQRIYYKLFLTLCFLQKYGRKLNRTSSIELSKKLRNLAYFDSSVLDVRIRRELMIDTSKAISAVSIESIRSPIPFRPQLVDNCSTQYQREVVSCLREIFEKGSSSHILSPSAIQFASDLGVLQIIEASRTMQSEYLLTNTPFTHEVKDYREFGYSLCHKCVALQRNCLPTLFQLSLLIAHWTQEKVESFFEKSINTEHFTACGLGLQLSHSIFGTRLPVDFWDRFLLKSTHSEQYRELLANLFSTSDDKISASVISEIVATN